MTEQEMIRTRLFCLECKDVMERDDWTEWYALRAALHKMYADPSDTRVFAIYGGRNEIH